MHLARYLHVLVAVIAITSSDTASSQNALNVRFIDDVKPTFPIGAGDVYGYVTFKVSRSRSDAQNSKFWLKTTERLYGSTRDGNYILALELKDNDKVIAREVIAEYSISNIRKPNENPIARLGSFFGLDTSSVETKQTTNTQWNGSVFSPGLRVTNENNNLKASVSLYYSNSQIFNGNFFSQLAKASSSLANIAVPVPGLDTVATVIDKVLGSYTQKEVISSSDTYGMSFISNGGQGLGYKLLTHVATIPGTPDAGEFRLTIEFRTTPTVSGVLFDTARRPRGQFVDPLVDKPFASLSVAGMDLISSLTTASETKDLIKFLIEPDGVKEPNKTFSNIGAHCNRVMSYLMKNFSTRDASLAYWAILKRYEPVLMKIEGHSECLQDFRKTELNDLGLTTDRIFIRVPVQTEAKN